MNEDMVDIDKFKNMLKNALLMYMPKEHPVFAKLCGIIDRTDFKIRWNMKEIDAINSPADNGFENMNEALIYMFSVRVAALFLQEAGKEFVGK